MELTFNKIMNKLYRHIFLYLIFSISILAQQYTKSEVHFIATGDLNLAHWITPVLDKQGREYPYKYIKNYLNKADLVFSNLEAPFCNEGQPFPKNFVFKVPEKHIKSLKAGNINLVSLANNHILDYGIACLESTIKLLRNENIQFAGAGLNYEDAHKPALFEINNIKFAFFSYSMTLPKFFFATDSSGGTAYPDRRILKKNIKLYNDKVDFILVSFHWGQELTEYPKEYQQKIAHLAIDCGADLILGHHPHVLQGIESYKGKIILYSLANFIFASYSRKAADSILLDLVFTKDGTRDIKILPINVNNYDVKFQPRIVIGEKKKSIIDYLNQISQKLNGNKKMITFEGDLIL